jgi:metal-responsive CopG/Arc/MetJ family transcriptional regulator
MTCTISDELLAELDEACYQSRVCRSEFVREALAIYLKNFHAQSNKLDTPNEKALAAYAFQCFLVYFFCVNFLFLFPF